MNRRSAVRLPPVGERVLVLGPGGSGRTTLAVRLGEQLSVPVLHLDSLLRETDDVAQVQRWLAEHRRAVVDGNHLHSLPSRAAWADTAVVLDLPAAVCVLRVLRRHLHDRARLRPRFLWGVLRFSSTRGRTISQALAAAGEGLRVVTVRPTVRGCPAGPRCR